MQVTKEQANPCEVILKFELDVDEVNLAYDKAYKQLGTRTNVPGFRPGKAPRKILENYVNQEHLQEQATRVAATKAYEAALKQEDIKPYDDPEVDFGDLAEGQPWNFTATVPLAPEVTLGDYETVSVERPIYTVSEADVDREVDELLRRHAEYKAVTDRGVQADDTVIAEVKITVEGAEEPAEPVRNMITLGNNIPGFDENITGMLTNETRTFNLTFPEDYQNEERAGKNAQFEVTVANINMLVPPELTDEWVAASTSFKTIEELRGAIRESSQESLNRLSAQSTEAKIIDALIERSVVHFPSVLVAREVHEDMHELEHDLEKRRMSREEYLKAIGMTEEQHLEQMTARAARRVTTTLLLRELAVKEDIDAAPEEIDAEFRKLGGEDVSADEIRRLSRDEGRRTRVANSIVNRKLREFMFAKASIKDVASKPTDAE